MGERPAPQPSPENLLQLKGEVISQWDQLPPEHQASMALVLYTQVLEGEYGPWLRSSTKVLDQRESDTPFKSLPVIRLTPEHLAQAQLTEDEITQLSDEDLRFIGYEIVRHYTNDVFWQELEFQARKVLEDKQQDS